jgi:hypothetical protein
MCFTSNAVGANQVWRMPLDDVALVAQARETDLLALVRALDRLSRIDRRKTNEIVRDGRQRCEAVSQGSEDETGINAWLHTLRGVT